MTIEPSIALIAAVASNGAIGRDNKLLWRLRSDLRRFRSLTVGKPVLMGRKTYESIGKPLPDRVVIVVTRDHGFAPDGVTVAHSLADGLAEGRRVASERGLSEVMIAGGGDIYAQTIAQAGALYLTEVDLEPEGDAFFPPIDRSLFKEVKRVVHTASLDDEPPSLSSIIRDDRRSALEPQLPAMPLQVGPCIPISMAISEAPP